MREGLVHPEWALCLGGGSGVWDDVLAWEQEYGRQWDGMVIAANDIGSHWPRSLDHWVSLHPNKFPRWEDLRQEQELPGGYVRWAAERHLKLSDRQVRPWAGGSSGMLAAQVALSVGCTRAILCGIPMTPSAHFSESREPFGPEWRACAGHWKAWTRHQALLDGWTRSMSGRTRELLGFPTVEWLVGVSAGG